MAPNTALAAAPADAATPQPSLAHTPLVEVLRLIRTPNVGPLTFFQLLRRFGSVQEALAQLPSVAKRGGKALAACSAEQAQQEIAAANAFGARMLRYGEPDYPALLTQITDAPPLITILGTPACWTQRPCIGMVGARNASANGCAFAQKLARELGAAGYTIASGLARGIDTFVHKGSLPTGTVGVIAGGIDNIYPPENAALFQQLRAGGAIISEQPFGGLPFAGSFPGRNRIISGMARGVVVVEASLKSGSLITSRFALEQGREVFAVPGSPLDPRSAGANALIKQGAHLVEGAQDVMDGLSLLGRRVEEERVLPFSAQGIHDFGSRELEEAHALVAEKLSPTPVLLDELLNQCQLTGALLFTVLMELELAGRLSRLPGGRVCLRIE